MNAAGQVVRYRFEADAVVDFNIHTHRGDEVIYRVKVKTRGWHAGER